MNQQIHAKDVRLLSENGEQLGIVPFQSALSQAQTKGLDLVLLNGSANPAVCKIMDYGKFKFDSIKKEKEIKKNQKVSVLKEIQLSMKIELHDMQTKAKHGNKFLENGDKLKVVLRMKGREQAYALKAVEIVKEFFALIEANGTIDKQPEIVGRNVIMIVTPKTNK
ncbi:MAG: translation initiation factor IF-3 [Clostridia bacterium]|nr:translation initiation factor IF-3 [Clostridia bacterium]